MVRKKPVPSLGECAKRAVPKLVKEHIVRCAHGIHAHWYRVFTGYQSDTPEQMLDIQVEKFKQYLHNNYVWTDREEFFKLILRGVDDGILQVRKSWNKSKKHEQYMKVMEALAVFTNIVENPKLRCLDFQDVPRSIRHRLLEMIPKFAGLRTLIIGPGNSGSWVPIKGKAAIELSACISGLKCLEHFSLKKDCNMVILSSLVHACGDRLAVLDVENSRSLEDEAVPVINQCRKITELNVFGTNISDEGKARLIMGLPHLQYLVRADFLCDALGWIDYLEEMENPVFDIREFMPSTSYFFHETWQVEIAALMCPNIQKMLFIQHPKCCPSLAPLEKFSKLTDLQIHGCDWVESGFDHLVTTVGPKLQNFGLISIKGLDFASLKHLFTFCTSLTGLVLNNCEFDGHAQVFHQDTKLVAACLEELVVTCNVRVAYIDWLLRLAPKVKVVHLGSNTGIKDSIFINLIDEGFLAQLEEIQIERSYCLSLATLNCLICSCQNLKSVGDLGAWGEISGPELGEMRQIVHEQNLQLDLSSHQVLRRFLGMDGEDRRQMMTLMTGPVLERIRMAQAATRNLQLGGQGL